MPDLDSKRKTIAIKLARRIALESELTVSQTRALVRSLQTGWRVPRIKWDEVESRKQYSDAMRLINAASILRSIDGSSSSEAQQCFRRSGEILEWLSRSKDNLQTTLSLELLSAAAYQLSGSPAMAAALLKQFRSTNDGEQLYSCFLRADFDVVLELVATFWQKNLETTDRGAQQRIIEEGGEDMIGWSFTIELVRILGLLSDAIRRGDADRYNLATQKLAALSRFANQSFSDDISQFLALLYQVTIGFSEASIYESIRRLGAMNAERLPHLEKFARKQFNRGRGILWASQQQGVERLIEKDSFALCTPTGSGKTLVANIALVKELLIRTNDEGPLALYVVPSRALAGEVEAKLSNEFDKDEFIVTGLYGGTDWGVTDYWLDAVEPTILIATVEKADALMRHFGPLLLQRLRLLILDEAHHVVPENSERAKNEFAEHSSRSLRLEAFISRLLACAPNTVRIALTAVAGGAALPVASWIEGQEGSKPVGSDFRSTRQIIGSFETNPSNAGRMRLEILNGKPLSVQSRIRPAYISLRIPPMPELSSEWRNSINRFNQLDVLWSALHLVDGERRILISITERPERTMGWFTDALTHDTWRDAPSLTFINDEQTKQRLDDARAVCVDYCGEGSYEVSLLDKGIASNHGQMPQQVRRVMVDLVSIGICPITIATATLTEGVNLPFDIIFVPSITRSSEQNLYVPKIISTAEFRNLAGRAGRPGAGKGIEGITLVPIPTEPSTTAESKRPTHISQIATMNRNWKKLKHQLLKEKVDQQKVNSPLALLLQGIAEQANVLLNVKRGEFLGWLESVSLQKLSPNIGLASEDETARLGDSIDELDGVLISALEELQRIDENAHEGASVEAALTKLWNNTFTIYAAAEERWMEAAFIRRGQAIVEELYPDREERSRLYQYGFTPYVGKRFEDVAPDIFAYLKGASDYGDLNDISRFEVFAELGDLMANNRGFGFRVRSSDASQKALEDWRSVFSWWMRAPDHEFPEPKDLRKWQRFVSNNIEFRLGLGIGAVVAVAWSKGIDGTLVVPTLDAWRETTDLPWFGFWARELLRWGTLDPLVAFVLAEGLVKTRESGELLRSDYDAWLIKQKPIVSAEDRIDPKLFLKWKRKRSSKRARKVRNRGLKATLQGTDGRKGRYPVIPVASDNVITWLDAAGFALAFSDVGKWPFRSMNYCDDFLLHTDRNQPQVTRVFKGVNIRSER